MEQIYIVLFMLIWSIGPLFIKLGLKFTPALDFLVLRAFVATISFFVIWLIIHFSKLKKKKAIPNLSWKNIPFIAGTALLLQVIYQASFFYALEYNLSPGLLMILLGVQPIFTALIMADKLSLPNWIGLGFGLIGLSLVVFNSIFIKEISLLGIAWGIAALMGMTLGSIGQKRFCSKIDFSSNLFLQYLISSAVFVCIDRLHVFHAIPFNTEFLIALFWMGFVVSVVATCLYYYLVNAKQLTHVTALFYGIPPLTVIFEYFIYGELVSSISLLGFFVTCLGLYFSLQFQHKSKKADIPKDESEMI